MRLARLIYASRATLMFSQDQLGELVRRSSVSNMDRNISGALVYCDGYFLQLLEGPEPALVGLLAKISLDPRHRDVQQLSLRPILSRLFSDWGMSFLHEDNIVNVDKDKITKILGRLHSAPCLDELGESASVLLEELKTVIGESSNAAGVSRAT